MEGFIAWYEAFGLGVLRAIALTLDLFAAAIIIYAGVYVFLRFMRDAIQRIEEETRLRVRLGRPLVLALEFLIGADILRTAIAPTWNSIGQLAGIILLRTLLEFVLMREIGEAKSSNAS